MGELFSIHENFRYFNEATVSWVHLMHFMSVNSL